MTDPRTVLAELVHQIDINDFMDSHGHAAKMLKPFHDARAVLAQPEAPLLTFDELQNVMSNHFGGQELTDDEADSAESFARVVETAVRRKLGFDHE